MYIAGDDVAGDDVAGDNGAGAVDAGGGGAGIGDQVGDLRHLGEAWQTPQHGEYSSLVVWPVLVCAGLC